MSEPRGRTPPHSAEAEEGLLGACLIDPGQEIISACVEAGFVADTFYLPAHQVIFQLMLELYNSEGNQAVDEVSLLDALQSRAVGSIKWLKDRQRLTDPKTPLMKLVGGPGVITRLSSRIESIANARYWLEIVRQKWLLRRLIETASHIVDEAFVNQDQMEHFIGDVEERILSINEDRTTDSAQPFEEAVDKAKNMIQSILMGKPDGSVLTGYRDIDKMTFGLQKGQMVVLAARPSMGKTSLGMNIAENVALPKKGEGKGILVFSLEMPADQLAMRMMCGYAEVSMRRVRDGMISNEQQRKLMDATKVLQSAPIWVDDSSGLNILQIRAKARRIKKQSDISLIVVDYLQLINGTDSRVPREQQISEISRGIKAMAKELDIPVLVLSQLNRASEKENRQPRISDLRESGSIEQDADVIFILATKQNSEEVAIVPQAARERDLIIAKQRNGATGSVPLTFIPEFTRFENHTSQPDS
ncbi:MAG TPA: replicative DNA helicase [Oceanipulchritudo sp.]|nr:replicative DNA helicase [Oceanipulchritudo sp.]